MNDKNNQHETHASLSRREFTVLSVAAGVSVASSGKVIAAEAETIEATVTIMTPDGSCDAAFVHPRGAGSWPGAVLYPDALGLRPVMREMAARLAASGYAVLAPNQFYRSAKAPVFTSGFSFTSKEDMARLGELRKPMTPAAVARDADAYVAFLDAQPTVKRSAKVGVFGYCMGGAMALRAAAAVPERIGAGASFHGGGLVTDGPDSPHLLIPKVEARFYIGIAANDDERQPDAKNRLETAFREAEVPAKIEVYPGTLHGWCVRDMPVQAGRPIYDEPSAERAWGELTALFGQTLT